MPGWTAGYVLHLEATGADSMTTSQGVPDSPNLISQQAGGTNGVSTLQSFWFIKSDQLGKISVGKQSQASDNTAILVDGSGSLVPANWVPFDFLSFFVRDRAGNSGPIWGSGAFGVWGDVNGLPTNSVRYDSPSFGGFSVSASWGEDDFWDVAARYAGEWADFKVAVAAAYSQTSNAVTNAYFPTGNTLQRPDTRYFQVGAYVEHIPTGLFAYGAYGYQDFGDSHGALDSNNTYYAKLGIRQRWNPLGHTVLYGEFERGENNNGIEDPFLTGQDARKAHFTLWGGGIVQEIDAAAMSLWLKYRNVDPHLSAEAGDPAFQTENFQEVTFGALINF
jgi:predicted porin